MVILYPDFEGVGVRGASNEAEKIIKYEALSYTERGQVVQRQIVCNEQVFSITENLFDALTVLRANQNEDRYLWIDTICINQRDAQEKAQQFQKMLMIYQNAMRVIAWLGKAHHDTPIALAAISANITTQPIPTDVRGVFLGPLDLYARARFRWIRVQQEIYAARKLIICCGPSEFSWSPTLSNPHLFLQEQGETRPEATLPKLPKEHVSQLK